MRLQDLFAGNLSPFTLRLASKELWQDDNSAIGYPKVWEESPQRTDLLSVSLAMSEGKKKFKIKPTTQFVAPRAAFPGTFVTEDHFRAILPILWVNPMLSL